MKGTTTPVGSRFTNELRALRDHAFAERCGSILRTVFPTLAPTQSRSPSDNAGIDHRLFEDGTDEIILIIQCKGFDVPEFGPSQLTQCLHSIKSFADSAFKTRDYFLVVNRTVKGEPRKKIEAELDGLVETGKAKRAELLGLEAFVEIVFQEAQKQLMQLLRSSVERFQKQHQQRMEEDVYVESVPFKTDDSGNLQKNPLRFVGDRILKLVSKSNNKRSWIFLSGEFGFGKTSLALHLAEALQKREIICLYLPVAQFHRQGLESEMPFMWEALRVVLQDEVDRENERNKILHAALKEIFKREKRILLLFDGIDEHPICWRENGLMNVFGIFKMFNVSCFFTVREEFLAERSGHFKAAIKGGPGELMLRLTEWNEELILEYLDDWQKSREANDDREHIRHFGEAVKNGRYVDYYGDIPKRPLFLKMLLEDVAKDDVRNRNLAELYKTYIIKKFEFDRASSVSNPVVLRPLSLDEDYEIVCARLFEVMTLAAGHMYSVEEDEVRIQPRLSESQLREFAAKVSGGSLDLPSILLNSVMVPVGRRNRNYRGGDLDVAFAHTSFQEFFLANFAIGVLLEKHHDNSLLSAVMPKPVMRFFQGLILGLSPGEQAVVHSRYAELRRNC